MLQKVNILLLKTIPILVQQNVGLRAVKGPKSYVTPNYPKQKAALATST